MTPFHTWFNSHNQEQASSDTALAPKRSRRFGANSLIALAIAGSTIGGGAVGAALTAQVFATPAAQAASLTLQPVAQTVETTNVAGAVLDSVGDSVVEINVTSQAARGPYTLSGTGSGFVIDASGLILTNRHVVESASDITIQFSNGEQRGATVVGSDGANDLALLRVSDMPAGIPAVTLGDSDAVAVGETAIAIGSPFGLEQTVTQGIISAVDRTYSASGSSLSHLIQTDAPINPGNSGGPLLNAQGEVIGITTLIESPVEGNVGVGFALPINTAKQQLAQLEAGTTLERGYLGISVQEATDPGQAGVTVAAVETGSGAAAAGLQVGDIVTAVDGTTIGSYDDLAAQLEGKQPGEQVTLAIQRDGAAQQVVVTLQSA
jgi:S1-C subfamily serine protease